MISWHVYLYLRAGHDGHREHYYRVPLPELVQGATRTLALKHARAVYRALAGLDDATLRVQSVADAAIEREERAVIAGWRRRRRRYPVQGVT